MTIEGVRTNQTGLPVQYRIDDVGMRRYWRVSGHLVLGLVEKRVRKKREVRGRLCGLSQQPPGGAEYQVSQWVAPAGSGEPV